LTSVQPFAGNVVPDNRMAATSATILQRFEPLPNINQNVVANNFLNTEGRPTNSNQENSRFDYVQSVKSTWMFRYGHAGELRALPTNIPNMANNIDVQGHQGMLRYTRVIGTNKVKHSFKMGGEVWRIRYNQLGGVVPRGRFTFNGQFSNNPLISTSSTAANAMTDFLLGFMSASEGQVGAPIANYRTNYYGLYFQDNWKISPRLTMNWGLRWEDQPPYYDKNDSIVNIDFKWDNSQFPVYVRAGTGNPLAGNPAFPLPSSIPYVRDGR